MPHLVPGRIAFDLARIEAGHVDYAIEEVDVFALVEGVTPMIEPQLQQKGIGFSTSCPPGLVVRTDVETAQQILLNLSVQSTPGVGSTFTLSLPRVGE
jgi:signal transduction histidine kinase